MLASASAASRPSYRMIWVYEHTSREPEFLWSTDACPFCNERLKLLHSASEDRSNVKARGWFEKRLFVCSVCGWWTAHGWEEMDAFVHHADIRATYGRAACLRQFDLGDVSMPIEEVRAYLVAKYEERFNVHPRVFEETVASVFRSLGYVANVTAYSGDGGVDVILQRGGETVGVQVKRYRNAIEVEQIRSLAGALVLGGMTRGMFVTTSGFRGGADSATKAYSRRGYEIELVNAERFYDALKLVQRTLYESFDDFPMRDVLEHLPMLSSEIFPRSDRWERRIL